MHDRDDLGLPASQVRLIRAVSDAAQPGTQIVVVLISGSAVDISPITSVVDAILWAPYGSTFAAQAIVDALLYRDEVTPGGRMPLTTYFANFSQSARTLMSVSKGTKDVPGGLTYKYYTGPALYPFGWGLAAAKFTTVCDKIVSDTATGFNISCTVTNEDVIRQRVASATLAVFSSPHNASAVPSEYILPRRVLVTTARLRVAPQEPRTAQVHLHVPVSRFCAPLPASGKRVLPPVALDLSVDDGEKIVAKFQVKMPAGNPCWQAL
jgi:hypothetical protein